MTDPADASQGTPRPAGLSGLRADLVGAALGLVLFGLVLLLVEQRWRPLLHLDDKTSKELHRYAVEHSAFVTLMKALSAVGSGPVYTALFAALAAWLAWRRRLRLALFVVCTPLGGSLLNSEVKVAVDRARPALPAPVAHANGMSFPSGHAQSAMVAYALLLLVLLPVLHGVWRRLSVAVAVVMVLGVGFSRVALGVHYVSDVLAGYALGAAWLAVTVAVFRIELRWGPVSMVGPPVEPDHG